MDKEYVTYRFDGWVFTPDEDKLNYQGETFTLDNRLSKLLHFFCQNPNTVFSRNELIDEVWNGSILTDQVITQAIFELRKTLKAPNRHAMGYIVTVPKRGYKFEIEHIEQQVDKPKVAAPIRVEKEPEAPAPAPASESTKIEVLEAEEITPDAEPQAAVIDEKPKVAVSQASTAKAPKKSPLVYILGIIVLVLAGILIMQPNQKDDVVAQDPVTSDQQQIHYLSLEPRYIFVDLKDDLKNDPFTIGIIRKLLDYLTVYKDYRIVFDETYVPNSANVVTFTTESSGDRKSLAVTYFNRTSNFKHLDRSYVIEPSTTLHSTIEVMLDDLLDAFKIDIPKSVIAEQVSELPDNQAALHHVLESLGYSLTVKYAEAIESVGQAYEISPDNHLIASDKYIFELASIFITEPSNSKSKVKQLNQTMKSQLMAMEPNPESFRVYDALAAYYLSLDEPKRAKEYLEKIPNHHFSIFSTVLYAKIEESSGNTASAEEYYYESIREAGSPVVLDLARKLFFNSNLKDIEAKIHSH
ncbi:transcriptional regulator CadC [Vibrio inusitatus NBRC 102082]|uniref:Transcriptional regulator CadC n=2 Tax=Vibrio TaxID=662 RepID=A0A4Y3HXS9_9VIBR|nr:winged helix-turn-helix domain-containing protein [Vibrio inusitatus]GEA51835.1 transcriptional regulator CadC [Vibrio inusitatus NBRC 102082]